MLQHKRLLGIVLLLIICLTLPNAASFAQGKASVPKPDQDIVNAVLAQNGQAPFTPVSAKLTAPDFVGQNLTQLVTYLGSTVTFDTTRAVNYSEHDSAGIVMVAVPLADASAGLVVDPNLKLGGQQGAIVGGLYVPGVGTIVVVAIPDSKGNKVSGRYFALANTTIQELSSKAADLTRRSTKSKAPTDAKGVAISKHEVCFTLNLDQVCLATDSFVPQAFSKSLQRASKSIDSLKKTWNVDVDVDQDNIVADLEGIEQRQNCANALAKQKESSKLAPECSPTIILGATKKQGNGLPIAFMELYADIQQQVFNKAGTTEIQTLKAGVYLIYDATPSLNQVGMIGALYLVSTNGGQFLTPYQVVEEFGDSGDSKKPAPQVAISDATVSGKDFFR